MGKLKILVVGLLLAGAMTGCGDSGKGDPSVATGDSAGANPAASASFDGAKYAKCMRDNGMDWFPEVTGANADLDIPEGVDRSKLDTALEACREYAPAGENGGQRPATGQDTTKALAYAKCMRESGVPDFPDPGSDGNMHLDGTVIDRESPTFQTANDKCHSILPTDDE